MSDLSPHRHPVTPLDGPDAPDGIEEGKRLMRVGGDKGLSLAERLAERFHKLTWRTPIHTMRLKGRYPLKLVAVPDDPVMGDVRRGHALLRGELAFQGRRQLSIRTPRRYGCFCPRASGQTRR